MKKSLLSLLLLTGSALIAEDQPYLRATHDTSDDTFYLEVIIPPTTNDHYLQLSHLNGIWETVQPKLDAFPDQQTTNLFFILNFSASTNRSWSDFFRTCSNPNATNSGSFFLMSVEQESKGYPLTDKKIIKTLLPPGLKL